MRRKKHRFQDFTEIKVEHCQHIIALLKQGDKIKAGEALHTLCLEVKDLKDYEAFMLAHKISKDAKAA
jgi:ASC-1-like (ASCH) protein